MSYRPFNNRKRTNGRNYKFINNGIDKVKRVELESKETQRINKRNIIDILTQFRGIKSIL